jgi:hypothetical protein
MHYQGKMQDALLAHRLIPDFDKVIPGNDFDDFRPPDTHGIFGAIRGSRN